MGETKKQTTYSFVRPGIRNDFSFVWSVALELMLRWMQGDPKHHDASSCGRATGKDVFAQTFGSLCFALISHRGANGDNFFVLHETMADSHGINAT